MTRKASIFTDAFYRKVKEVWTKANVLVLIGHREQLFSQAFHYKYTYRKDQEGRTFEKVFNYFVVCDLFYCENHRRNSDDS